MGPATLPNGWIVPGASKSTATKEYVEQRGADIPGSGHCARSEALQWAGLDRLRGLSRRWGPMHFSLLVRRRREWPIPTRPSRVDTPFSCDIMVKQY